MKTIRAAVIGTGWGRLQLEALRRVKGVQLAALCDTDRAQLEQVAAQYRIATTYADYRDLMADDSIDWVCVASPPAEHEAMLRAAISAGKHVFTEKPAALSPVAAAELRALAGERGVVHATGYEMRFLAPQAYCKELIDEGYLGSLLRVDVSMTMEHPWGDHGNWAADAALGGGILLELGAHFVDMLRWWFGDVQDVLAGVRTNYPVVHVPDKQVGNGHRVRQQVTGDDSFWCVFRFVRGGEALVNFISGARHDPGWAIGAYGSNATLLVRNGQLLAMEEGDKEMGLLPIPKRLELGDSPSDPLMWATARLLERALAKIHGKGDLAPFPNLDDDVAVLRIVDAIRASSAQRRWVSVE